MTRSFTLALGLLLCLALSFNAAAGPPTAEKPDELAIQLQELNRLIEGLAGDIEELRKKTDTSEKVSELERRIALLTRELERLQMGDRPAIAKESEHGFGPAASKVYGVDHGVSIGGYGEMLYEAFSDERDDGTASGKTNKVDFLRAVFYIGYKFSDKLLFNSEIEIEHAATGESGSVSAEFAYIDFMWRPEVNFRAGLVLLPIGIVNELHEPPTYLGTKRPETERRIIPSTWRENGAGIFGDFGKFSYRAYVTNGLRSTGFDASGIRGGRQKGSKALAENLAFSARVDYEPAPGTLLGASFYTGDSSQEDTSFGANTSILEAHGQVDWNGVRVRGLFAHATVDNADLVNAQNGLTDADSIGETLIGGYLEAGYDVLWNTDRFGHSLTPYLRWEGVDTQNEVPDGFSSSPSTDVRILTLGAAWKPHPQVVVKADWQDIDNDADTATDQFNVQLGYLF